ncbi:MAG: ABC transporter ATP-binding protein [Patescibacteria group bacterium]
MSDEIAIKVDNVSKNFVLPHEKVSSVKSLFTSSTKKRDKGKETQHALKDISFEIKKGEFFGIVGRNGSGKSTLLKILAGIYQPTVGSVSTKGKLVPFIELGVGFNPELTGRENVYLNGALLGFSKKDLDSMYDAIVEFAELERFMDQKLKNYSSGMQVRLAFSMATRAEADILLVDEVLAVGDADFQRKCYNYFRELKKNKKTVVFVSHDMDAIKEYCDKAIMIEQSVLISSGAPSDVAVEYQRLFTESETSGGKDGTGKRWGDGHIKFKSVELHPTDLKTEKELEITASAVAHADIDNPIFGFSISNSAGQEILGTNTKIKQVHVPPMKKGETLQIHWSLPHIFGDGKYYVNLAVVEGDGITNCDNWREATSFDVFKEERTPYVITPDVSVRIMGHNR